MGVLILVVGIVVAIGIYGMWSSWNPVLNSIDSKIAYEINLRQELLEKVTSGHFGIYGELQLLFLVSGFQKGLSPEYLATIVHMDIMEIEMLYYQLSYLSAESLQRLLLVLSYWM